MLLQKLYIPAFNYAFRYTQRIAEKWRDMIVEACLCVFALMAVVYPSAPESEPRSLLSIILLLVMTVMSVNKPLRQMKISAVPCAAWVIFTAGIMFSFFDPASKNDLACISLTILPFSLPMFYFVWANRGDFDRLFTFIARSYSNVITLYGLYTFFFDLIPSKPESLIFSDALRYSGLTTHPNHLGLLMLGGFVCSMYMLIITDTWKRRIPYMIGVCLESAFTLLSASRTSMIILAACAAAAFLFTLLRRNKALVLTAAAAVALTVLSAACAYGYTAHVMNVVTSSAATSSSDVVLGTALGRFESSEERVFGDFENPILNKLDSYLSGRPTVWMTYLSSVGLRPHYMTKEEILNISGLSYVPIHAHNEFINSAYLYGAIAGIGEFALAVAASVYALIRLFRKDTDSSMLFFVLAVGAYMLCSMMESPGLPLNRAIVTVFFLAIAPMFTMEPQVDIFKDKKD